MSYVKFLPYAILLALAAPTAIPVAVPPPGEPLPRVDGFNADFLDGLSSEDLLMSVDEEAAARIAADDAEAQAREDADAAEAGARIAADEAEAQARADADATLGAAIQDEAALRAAQLGAEENVRSAADGALQNAVQAEAAARAAGDGALQQALGAESQTRSVGDAALQGALDAETAERAAVDATLQQDLASEAQTRAAADAALSSQLLGVAAYSASLTNRLDFVNSGATNLVTLKYGQVQQHVAPDVFEALPNGGIKVKKQGVIVATANMAVKTPDYAELHGMVLPPGANPGESGWTSTLAHSAGGDRWTQATATMTLVVPADWSIHFRARPSQITDMTSVGSLSLTWIGVR